MAMAKAGMCLWKDQQANLGATTTACLVKIMLAAHVHPPAQLKKANWCLSLSSRRGLAPSSEARPEDAAGAKTKLAACHPSRLLLNLGSGLSGENTSSGEVEAASLQPPHTCFQLSDNPKSHANSRSRSSNGVQRSGCARPCP
jgi:hypothetical protein